MSILALMIGTPLIRVPFLNSKSFSRFTLALLLRVDGLGLKSTSEKSSLMSSSTLTMKFDKFE